MITVLCLIIEEIESRFRLSDNTSYQILFTVILIKLTKVCIRNVHVTNWLLDIDFHLDSMNFPGIISSITTIIDYHVAFNISCDTMIYLSLKKYTQLYLSFSP